MRFFDAFHQRSDKAKLPGFTAPSPALSPELFIHYFVERLNLPQIR
jgi:hypothetical protein